MKLISRETVAGRMVDVASVSVCRCGRRFDTDGQLDAHVVRPITLFLSERSPPDEAKTPERASLSLAEVELQ